MGGGASKKCVEFGGDVWTVERMVGRGAFGKVYALMNKKSDIIAMKVLSKGLLIEKKAVTGTLREKEFLAEFQHPFIVNLLACLQNKSELFMLLDFMQGGDLSFHLTTSQKGILPEPQVKFYTANILIALEYLHSEGIVHRDIKPDNIMLDRKGYAHLTDFNVSKKVDEKGRLNGYAGTFVYMAPELFDKGSHYTATVDIWSLGVVLYRMLGGRIPWTSKAKASTVQFLEEHADEVNPRAEPDDEERQQTIKRICRTKVRCSKRHFSPEAAEVVHAMIAKADQRATVGDIMRMAWFKDIDWDLMRQKALKPPFRPAEKPNVDCGLGVEEAFLGSQKVAPPTDDEQVQFYAWNWISSELPAESAAEQIEGMGQKGKKKGKKVKKNKGKKQKGPRKNSLLKGSVELLALQERYYRKSLNESALGDASLRLAASSSAASSSSSSPRNAESPASEEVVEPEPQSASSDGASSTEN